ncbi:MAG: HepT-like ribonuclease domain-containing protein [Bacteroidota bacterium]
MLRRAIEREIEIIGEAMNRILKLESKFEISNARRIVDTKNWVIYAYDNVDEIIVWGIISNDLPKLKEEIALLLKED